MSDDTSSLDPADWPAFRALAHRALDDTLDTLSAIREGPAWQPMPPDLKAAIVADPLPLAPTDAADVYAAFVERIAPYAVDNRHPRFFGWVHGAGTPLGVLAELLTAGLNVNAGGRDHAAVYVERCVIAWWRELFGFPPEATGILTTGSSMANVIAIQVARRAALGPSVRETGIAGVPLVGYASHEAHGSVRRAFEVAGLGGDALRSLALDDRFRLDPAALSSALAADRAAGLRPFVVIATAGSAGLGAIDDLPALADFCAREKLWLHVDGAFGAMVRLAPSERRLVDGLERADSLAFDLHKWMHVHYDCGAVLVRDGALHSATFADEAPYLARTERGTAAGAPWFTDYGPELSRGFRALKVWFAMRTFGVEALGEQVAGRCVLARELGERIARTPELELLAPVTLNIVCFRYAGAVPEAERDAVNAAIVVALQESGLAVPSTTRVNGKLGIHLNVMNHRTSAEDLTLTLDAVLEQGAALRI